MELIKQIHEAPNSNVAEVLIRKNVTINYIIDFNLQDKQFIPAIKKDIDEIVKNSDAISYALKIYGALIDIKENTYKDPKKDKLEFLMSFKAELIKMITPDNYDTLERELTNLLRRFFIFYATYEDYHIEGLKFFSLFPEIIKREQFNSIKAFLFYFAYQIKRYNTKEVKEILSQSLINANIITNKIYLDFCMYCFYRGMLYLEKKDFYMASYYYCSAVVSGFKNNLNNIKLVNGFTSQMIRSLCFLKYLTNFNIKGAIYRETRYQKFDDFELIDHQDIPYCLNFLNKEKDDLKDFKDFIKEEEQNIKNCSLEGLKRAAEDELIFGILKKLLKVYKKIKMTKIAQEKQLEVKDIMRILKRKVLEGEINIKYDEAEDVIETFDIDPGLKEKVKKTSELYEKIIEGNKNMFINLKKRKMDQLSGKLNEKELLMAVNGGMEDIDDFNINQFEMDED